MNRPSRATRLATALCAVAWLVGAAAAAPGARAPADLALEPERGAFPVAEALLLVDESRTLTIERLRELEREGAADWRRTRRFNFGYSRARHWLKIPLVNGAPNSQWTLEFAYPLIQVLRFHQFADGEEVAAYATGRLRPIRERPVPYRTFLFDFSMPEGGRGELYVMVESEGTVFAPMTLYRRDAFRAAAERGTAAIGIYSGVLLAMVLTNAFLFFAVRDRAYLLYVGYVLGFGLLMNTLNGMTYQYLWPEWVEWNKVSVPVLAGVCYLFLALFTRSFLRTRERTPRLDRGLDALAAGSVFLIAGGAFGYGVFVNRCTSLLISLAPLVVAPIALRCARLGSRAALFYAVAFGCFFLGSAAHAARDLGWVPQSFAVENGPYLGSALEMLILSLGLAFRVKRLKEKTLRSELRAAKAARKLAESRRRLDAQRAVAELAAQVAHDIRSPLAALDAAMRDAAQLPEDKRALVRGATARIRGIAEELIETERRAGREAPGAARAPARNAREPASRELLSPLAAALVSEKRLQFRARPEVALESRLGEPAYGLFAEVQPGEFKRVLSNLIDNGVEAVAKRGTVALDLRRDGDWAAVTVEDDGRGIPPELLDGLGRRGRSFGKPAGTGLGLYHARARAKAWGGTLGFAARPGGGTIVTLRLPALAPPRWFVPALRLRPGSVLVALDDDPAIHEVWRERLRSAGAQGIELLHFSGAAELRAWTAAEPAAAREAVYLLDYELRGSTETGLSLAQELDLGERAVLVTGRFDEKPILGACLRLRMRMIPKSQAAFVPIELEGAFPGASDAVLIDDDPLVQMTWKVAAAGAGKTLKAFSRPGEFWAAAAGIGKRTPIYVDSKLGGGVRGEEFAKELYERGFRNLFLATARARDGLPPMPWIRAVVGKEAPWKKLDRRGGAA